MTDKPANRSVVSSSIDELHLASIMVDSREIFIHGHSNEEGTDSGVDHRMANQFVKNIRFLAHLNDKPIIIHQHSIGGDWNAGIMMYDAIKTCEVYVIIITHGIAASMGSIVPQAADLRLTMPNCDWLIHDGTTGIHPGLNQKQRKSWGKLEDRLGDTMLDIYASKCMNSKEYLGKTQKQTKTQIMKELYSKEDWWLSAEEALSHGFIDGVFGTEKYINMTILKEFGYT